MKLRVTLPILGLVLLFAAGAVITGLVFSIQSKNQAVKNQAHFDCAVSVFARTEPPKCAKIIAEFRRNGVFPPAPDPAP